MLDIISSDEFKVQNPFLNTFAAEKWVEDTVALFLFWVDGWQLWVFVKKIQGIIWKIVLWKDVKIYTKTGFWIA